MCTEDTSSLKTELEFEAKVTRMFSQRVGYKLHSRNSRGKGEAVDICSSLFSRLML